MIQPNAEHPKINKGTQVSLREKVKDDNDKDVAKIKLESNGEIMYTSFGNIKQVQEYGQTRNYTFIKDYKAQQIPFAGNDSDKEYKKDAEIIVNKHFEEYVKVKSTDGDVKGHWIEKSALIWTNTITEEDFLQETNNATEVGTKFTGNETSIACNICVRSALLIMKEDPTLFPEEGSAFYDPKDAFQESYVKGHITNPGRAKNMKLDFDVISTKLELDVRFKEIKKKMTKVGKYILSDFRTKRTTEALFLALCSTQMDQAVM